MIANTYFPLGSGPRKSIFKVSKTSSGKGDACIFDGGVIGSVD